MRMQRAVFSGLALICLPFMASAANVAELISKNDRAAALAAIQAGSDVNVTLGDGSTPLLWAVYKVDAGLARELLAHGAKPNVRSNLGALPLSEATNLAHTELVSMLLKAKADPNLANADGETPLMLAARVGSLEIVQMLVKAGANVNVREQWREQTALMWAVGGSFPEVAAYLISKKADIEARAAVNDWGSQITSEPRAQYRPAGGMTVLLYATRSGCMECVKALIKAGVDINRPNPDGITPLMAAIDNMQFGVANYLLDQKANPHTFDWWGRTPLYNAIDMRSFSSRFEIGAGNTPAEGAAPPAYGEALALAKRLLEMGANPNIQLNMHRPGRGANSGRFTDDLLTTGCSPLLRAAVAMDRAAVELLLAHGAIVDLPNVMGVTPLMAASGVGISQRDTRGSYGPDAQDRSLATLAVLLKAGANINARVTDTSGHSAIIARPSSMTNRQGQTAIFGAINWGWTRVAQFLLDNGAKVDVKDDAGKTVVDALTGAAGGRDLIPSEDMKKLIKAAAGVA
jgi:uncharacterized protein